MVGLNDKDKQNALNEIRLLASVSHENVVQYKESFIDVSQHQTLCLVMEYCEEGDMLSKIEANFKHKVCFAEYEIWSVLVQCLCGLKALHDLKVMHRDIKSANILVSKSGACKLADFNVSKVVRDGLLRTQTGTPYYASPEVWNDQPYDVKSDVWSLGCVLYEVAAGRVPFKANDMKGLYKKVCQAAYPPLPTRYSQALRDTITSMLTVDACQRPDCDELLTSPTVIAHIKHLSEYDTNVV